MKRFFKDLKQGDVVTDSIQRYFYYVVKIKKTGVDLSLRLGRSGEPYAGYLTKEQWDRLMNNGHLVFNVNGIHYLKERHNL